MDCIAAYIKALLYKESLEDRKSLIDKNPKFKKRLEEYKEKREQLQKQILGR